MLAPRLSSFFALVATVVSNVAAVDTADWELDGLTSDVWAEGGQEPLIDADTPAVTTIPPQFNQDQQTSTSLEPVTTTALTWPERPSDHWTPERHDPYVCEYLGENQCWKSAYPEDDGTGPPYSHDGVFAARAKTCIIPHLDDPDGDDAPAILAAFNECKSDAHIVFEDATYYVRSVMNTTGLQDVSVEILGTLLWSTDIPYWLSHSLFFGFQNQTSAWHIGGDGLHIYGHGKGTLDGNGQVWYDYNKGQSNLHGRPHALTITNTTNSVVEGLRFVKSQMWTMTLIRSERVLLQDIYVNNTSEAGRDFRSNVNTDGIDTAYANNITMLRWTVDCGDDSISMKQNSTNIYIANCTFYHGESFAMGSIGQYPGQIEVIENITAVDINCYGTEYAGRVKTWSGRTTGYPPNGGGGGIGHAKNITFSNFKLENVRVAWAITQCTSYNGVSGGCDTSLFKISDLKWGNTTGTTKQNVASLQCSGNAPCEGINLFDNDLTLAEGDKKGQKAEGYLCNNVPNPEGFECTGKARDDKPT